MLRVSLVVVSALFGLQALGELGEDGGEDCVDGRLEIGVGAPVPDHDEVGVEAAGEGDAGDVVACVVSLAMPQ